MSTPGNLTNGKTASLTLRDNDRSAYASLSPTRLVNTSRVGSQGTWTSSVKPICARVSPSMQRLA